MYLPKVQIIIPVYNAGPYLKRCLDSVRTQTFAGWQAILVDDASTDGSWAAVCEAASADSRFVCIRQAKNQGAAAARNRALQRLCSEYTAFLDADDYWEPDMLAVLLEKAETYHCDVVQCRFLYDFAGGKQALSRGAFPADKELFGESLRAVYLKMITGISMNHVCMKLIRTQCMEGLVFDQALKTAEDLQFCIALFQRVERYYFVDMALYHYCRNAQSLTGKGLPLREKIRANACISKTLVRTLPAWGMDTMYYRALAYLRPCILVVLKILRMAQEQIFKGMAGKKGRGEKHAG